MKKIFTLFLALALVFLTACNTKPSVDGSTGSKKPNVTEDVSDWKESLRDQIITKQYDIFDLSSRIVFQIGSGSTYYYSKADGKAYIYCYDPICDHTDYTCLAKPGHFTEGFGFTNTAFINDRFWCVTLYGKIYSFSFDGSDKKLEYDAGYGESMLTGGKSRWGAMISYGPYIYIQSKAEETPHTLRFNVETKEMQDLTEKTGNYVHPLFFYDGMIYGQGDNTVNVDAFYKADLELETVEEIDDIPFGAHAGSILVGNVTKERESIEDSPEKIGISFYDMKTGEQRIVTKEELGLDYYPTFVAATDEYFYFYKSELINLGTVIINHGGKDKEVKVQKMNDGKLYRMNKDGTNIVCVYNNPDYELNRNVVIYDNKIVMQGQYIALANGEKKVWGGPIQVATINPDGTFGEFTEVEVLQ